MTRALGILFLVTATATHSAAQTAANLPRWDIAVGAGVFVAHPQPLPEIDSYQGWYRSWALSTGAGRYLSPHLKVEGEVTLTGAGRLYGQRDVEVPGFFGPYPILTERVTRTTSASGALVWQFFDNQWVHPFVLAGAALDFDRRTDLTHRQTYYRGEPNLPPREVVVAEESLDHHGIDRVTRAFVGGGAKVYVSSRAFFRADSRLALGSDESRHVLFRLAFGVDF